MGTSDPFYFPWHKKLAYNLDPFLYKKRDINALSIAETQAPLIYYYLERINIKFNEIKTFDFCDQESKLTKYMTDEGFKKISNQIHIKGDFNNQLTKFNDATFDFITAFRCTPYMEKPEDFFKEMHRLLKPGGVLIVDWVNGFSDFPLLDLGFCWNNGDADIFNGKITSFNQTSYIDQTFLDLFPEEFKFLINHINKPNLRKRFEAIKYNKWKLALSFPNKYKFSSSNKLSLNNYVFEFGLEMKNKKLNLLSQNLFDQLGFKIITRDILNPYKFNKKTILFLNTILMKNI